MLLAAMPGMALSAAGAIQLNRSLKKSLDMTKTDLVDTKKTALKYAPDMIVATNVEELSNIPSSESDMKVMRKMLDHAGKRNNAVYLAGRNALIATPTINRSLLGHEIGHSRDPNRNKPSLFDYAQLLGAREQRAWDASPFQDAASKKVSKELAGTYHGGDKVILGGTLAGAGASIALALPLLLKALKK